MTMLLDFFDANLLIKTISQVWWHTPLIPEFGKKASLVYKASARTARAITQRNLSRKTKNKTRRVIVVGIW